MNFFYLFCVRINCNMWFFKKKVAQDDFTKFKTNVKSSFRRYKRDIKFLKQKNEFLEKEINKVKPLSKQFSGLQKQLNETASRQLIKCYLV